MSLSARHIKLQFFLRTQKNRIHSIPVRLIQLELTETTPAKLTNVGHPPGKNQPSCSLHN